MPKLTLQQMKEIAEKARKTIIDVSIYSGTQNGKEKFMYLLRTWQDEQLKFIEQLSGLNPSEQQEHKDKIGNEINTLIKNYESLAALGRERINATKIYYLNKSFDSNNEIRAQAAPSKNHIEVSLPVIKNHGADVFYEILLHEFAHIYDYSLEFVFKKFVPNSGILFSTFSEVQEDLFNKILDHAKFAAYKNSPTGNFGDYLGSTAEVYARGIGPLIRSHINKKKNKQGAALNDNVSASDIVDLFYEFYTQHYFAPDDVYSQFLSYFAFYTKIGQIFKDKLIFFTTKKYSKPNQTINYRQFLYSYLTSGEFEKDWPDIKRSILADPIASETARTINQIAKAETQQASMVAEAKLRKHFKRFL